MVWVYHFYDPRGPVLTVFDGAPEYSGATEYDALSGIYHFALNSASNCESVTIEMIDMSIGATGVDFKWYNDPENVNGAMSINNSPHTRVVQGTCILKIFIHIYSKFLFIFSIIQEYNKCSQTHRRTQSCSH